MRLSWDLETLIFELSAQFYFRMQKITSIPSILLKLGSGHKVWDTRAGVDFEENPLRPPCQERGREITKSPPPPRTRLFLTTPLPKMSVLKQSDIHETLHREVKLRAEFKNRGLKNSTHPHHPLLPTITHVFNFFTMFDKCKKLLNFEGCFQGVPEAFRR